MLQLTCLDVQISGLGRFAVDFETWEAAEQLCITS